MLIECNQCKKLDNAFAWGFARAGFKKIVLDIPICKECIIAYLEPRRILCEFSINYENEYKILRIVGKHDNTPKSIEDISKNFRLLEIILTKQHVIEVVKN